MYEQLRAVVPVNAASTTNGATAQGYVDTLGYDFLTLDVVATTADVVSNSPSVLKLQEGDTTSSFSDIVGARGGTDFTIPNALTSATNNYKFNLDLRARKRYVQVVVSPRTTQSITVVANLGRAEQSPITATKANALTLVEL